MITLDKPNADLSGSTRSTTYSTDQHINTDDTSDFIEGRIPLTPAQRLFFWNEYDSPNLCNIGFIQYSKSQVSAELFRVALLKLLTHHDALRAKFLYQDNDWQQIIVAPDKLKIDVIEIDCEGLSNEHFLEKIEEVTLATQDTLQLDQAALIKVWLFSQGEGKGTVIRFLSHHLLYDGFSDMIFRDELMNVYRSLAQGDEPTFPVKTSSLKAWVDDLIEQTNSHLLDNDLTFWSSLPSSELAKIPLDYPENAERNTQGSMKDVVVLLPKRSTRKLLGSLRKLNVSAINTLVHALMASLLESSERMRVNIIGSGRDISTNQEIDVSKTVGWLATVRAFVLNGVSSNEDYLASLRNLDKKILAAPNDGYGLSMLSAYHHSPSIRQTMLENLPPQIDFNFRGTYSSISTDDKESIDTERLQSIFQKQIFLKPNNIRSAILYCEAGLISNELYFKIEYSENLHTQETIKKICDSVIDNLETLITQVN